MLVHTDNTAVVSYINHQGGLLVAPPVQADTSDPCVVPGKTPLAESSLHPGASQCGSRHPVEAGAGARGMMLHTEVVKQIWRVFGQAQVDVFATRETL